MQPVPVTAELYTSDKGRDDFTRFVATVYMPTRPVEGDHIFLPAGTYEHPGIWTVLRVLWIPRREHEDHDAGVVLTAHNVARCVVTRSHIERAWFPHPPGERDPYKVGEQ